MYQRSLSRSHGDALGIADIVIIDVLLGIAAIAVSIRFYSRRVQRHGLFLNDYAVVLAWIFAAGLVITSNITFIPLGIGERIRSMSVANVVVILKAYIAATEVALASANTFVKISIVHFYITIFRSNKAFLNAAHAVIVLVVAFGVGLIVSYFLQCRQLATFWDYVQPGVCESPIGFAIASSSCNAAIDVIIVLLPMPMIWTLQMATLRKIELTIAFALGFLVCIVTIIRLILYIKHKHNYHTWGLLTFSVLNCSEPLLGIIIACLPLFPPALKKITGLLKKTKPEVRNVIASSMARRRLKRLEKSTLHRFDDSLFLTELENIQNENSISGTSGKMGSLVSGRSQPSVGVEMPSQSSLQIGTG